MSLQSVAQAMVHMHRHPKERSSSVLCKSKPKCTVNSKQINNNTIVGLRGPVGGSQDVVLVQLVLYPAGVRLEGSILTPTSLSDMFYPLKSESATTTQQNSRQAEMVQQWFSMSTFSPVELFQKMSKMKNLQTSMVSLIHLDQLSQPLNSAQQPLQQSNNWPANMQYLLQYAGFNVCNKQFTAQILSSNSSSEGENQCNESSQTMICDSSHSGEEQQQVSLPGQEYRLRSAYSRWSIICASPITVTQTGLQWPYYIGPWAKPWQQRWDGKLGHALASETLTHLSTLMSTSHIYNSGRVPEPNPSHFLSLLTLQQS